MKLCFAAIILLFAVFIESHSVPPAPIKSSLDLKETQLERLYATYWEIQYRLEQGDETASDKEIEAQIREVINDPAFLNSLKAVKFDDPVLQRRRELFLDAAMDSKVSTDPELAKLVEAIRKDGSSLRYRVGERMVDRPELDNVLAQQADRELRRVAWYAEADLTRTTGARIQQAMMLRNRLGLRYTGTSFSDFMLKRRATDRESLVRWYQQIRTATEPDYQALLLRITHDLHVQRVEPWDLEYYFSTLAPELEKKLGTDDAWPRAEQVAAVLGFDFKQLPVSVKVADITFGGYTMPIWYGKEIKMLVNKRSGTYFADTVLHESGHALHFALVNEPTFLLKDNYPPPMDEGLGQTMCLMLYRPQFATGVYGLSTKEAQALAERYRLQSLYEMRRLMTHSEFELQAYDDPNQDFTALYDRICSKYLDVDCHHANTWAYDPFYAAIPLYEQNYILAEMFAYQVHHTLDQKFGSTLGPAAGSYLSEKYFTRGGMLTLNAIMEQGTGEKLTPDYLIAALKSDTASPAGH